MCISPRPDSPKTEKTHITLNTKFKNKSLRVAKLAKISRGGGGGVLSGLPPAGTKVVARGNSSDGRGNAVGDQQGRKAKTGEKFSVLRLGCGSAEDSAQLLPALGVDGDDLPAPSTHQKDAVQTFHQDLQELHV